MTAGTDVLITYLDQIAADASVRVFVVADVPLGRATSEVAGVRLTGTAAEATAAGSLGAVVTQTAGANTAGVDTVFADTNAGGNTARDGIHFDEDDYTIFAAALTATKTSRVISDPLNGTTNPKLIPGAVVEYCITVANGSGGAAAANVAISDTLPATTTYDASFGVKVNGTVTERDLQCRRRDRRRPRFRRGQRLDSEHRGGRHPYRAVPRHDQLGAVGGSGLQAREPFRRDMKTRAHLLCAALLALLASLILAAPARAGTPAPRTVSNIATISWDAGGQHVELPSNRVDHRRGAAVDPAQSSRRCG